jgi:Protein similar to CwfJ C-terminus 2
VSTVKIPHASRSLTWFPRWFAAEIIGNILDLEARLWRKPRWIDRGQNKSRVAAYKKKFDAYDWTKMLRAGAS